jgi:molybdate transport system substrate-binding protein
MAHPRRLALGLVLLVLGGLPAGAVAAGPPTVFAAASLTEVFPRIDPAPHYNFAGSNQLALQIRQGAPADVFASAAPNFTQDLFAAGLVEKPQFLAFNRLAFIIPKSNPAGITSVYDLRRRGIKLVIAAPAVPVGSYTRTVLRNLGLSSALANVVSQESDVKGVVGKVALGEADAGFVYVTDARAAASQLKSIPIPTFAQPKVRYEIAVVAGSGNKAAANAFIKKVKSPRGRLIMAQAGFKFPKPKVKPKPRPKPASRR